MVEFAKKDLKEVTDLMKEFGSEVSYSPKYKAFILRKGYYYRTIKLTDWVKEITNKFGDRIEIIKFGDIFKSFRGGSELKDSSHYRLVFKLKK